MAASLAVAIAREGVPFRKAHGLVGSLVARAAKESRPLVDIAAEELRADHPKLAKRVRDFFDPSKVVASKAARGGTAPKAVTASLKSLLRAIR